MVVARTTLSRLSRLNKRFHITQVRALSLWLPKKFSSMVLCRHFDHSLTLRAIPFDGVTSIYHAKSAKRQRAISSSSQVLACNPQDAPLNALLGFVLFDLITG
jgi:hypothetical protein